jgi:hypothetical protein
MKLYMMLLNCLKLLQIQPDKNPIANANAENLTSFFFIMSHHQ